MSKKVLMILGIVIVVIGILSIFNVWIFSAVWWYAVIQIVVGAFAVLVSLKK